MTITIERMTPGELDFLANRPDIYLSSGFPDNLIILAGKALEHPGNIGFVADIGGMVFFLLEDGVYDAHFYFIPGSGGKIIIDTARTMLNLMFTQYSAYAIKGYPPRDNRAVRVIGITLGFQKIPDEDFIDDLGRHCDTYILRRLV